MSQPNEQKETKRVSYAKSSIDTIIEDHPPTSYIETMMHLFKGNVGTGCYAMAYAVKNAGIIVGPVLTLIIAIICVHTQHVLIHCAGFLRKKLQLQKNPDFAEVIEICFANSTSERCQRMAKGMKKTCNVFICITQLGFCCVYFVFIGRNFKNVLDYYEIVFEMHVLVTIILIPIWLSTLIRKLKYIAIFSAIANFCMVIGIILIVGYAAQDLPPFETRKSFATFDTLPLYFGTALFAFEGIALVLPLQNSMKDPRNFSRPLGVLNVGMVLVSSIYILVGFIGYWKYGEDAQGSLTLNLPIEDILAQVIMLMIAIGVLLGYAIQFFVAIQIMFPSIHSNVKFARKYPVTAEILFRTVMVLVTFTVAQIVPNLSALLSLVGSVCCTVLAFVLPVTAELIILKAEGVSRMWFYWIKDIIILLIALAGFVLGGGISMKQIVEGFSQKLQ